ncbi:TNF receptor-associated factor 4 [Caerostris darwini]|uniref:TNF receptor-associated factor 4 n=1 Tax=Caerostris darwini TaxID=1538125 RepID=A0AAV4RY18_9ARAC|nr:TNF receptor-associated factor 4 [Caerostris darwini]
MINCFLGETKRRSKKSSICSSEGVFTCPEDNLPLDYAKIYPDPDAEVAIMGSVVYCIHYKEGCKWSDELRKLQGHLNMCKFDAIPCTNHCGAMIPRLVMDDHRLYTCPKRLTRCEYCAREFTGEALEGHVGSCQLEPIYCENKCGSKIQRRHQNQHRQQECTKRLVPCRYCQKEFVYDTLQIHTAKCPRLPVSCPNRCDVLKIAKEDLETHLSDHCTALTLSCTFKDMGCKFKGTRSALDQHLEDGTKPHLLLVCGVVSRQQHHINALRTAMQGLNPQHLRHPAVEDHRLQPPPPGGQGGLRTVQHPLLHQPVRLQADGHPLHVRERRGGGHPPLHLHQDPARRVRRPAPVALQPHRHLHPLRPDHPRWNRPATWWRASCPTPPGRTFRDRARSPMPWGSDSPDLCLTRS